VHNLIGLVPCVVHGNVERALVIGMGGGTTAGAVTRCTPDTTIIEISPGVVQAARAFGSQNGDVADSPTARTIIADGRNYLLVTDGRFDLMTADTIRPVHAQSGNLYSHDYYRLMAARLNPRGIVFQWVDVSLRDHEERILMRSFVTAFPHVAMSEIGGNKFLLGSNEPLTIDRESMRARLTSYAPGDLARAGVANADSFLASFALSDDTLRATIGPGPIISDDRPVNEYFALLRVGGLWKLLPAESPAYRPGS
jgi:spermidine synthase